MLTSKKIQKYKGRPVSWLLKRATYYFNSYIRERDKHQPCISCGGFKQLQCGHFYSSGHYPQLRFDEKNCHGQCLQCNYYLSGDLSNYRRHLYSRIGKDEVEKLDMIALNRSPFKWDRFVLIEIIETYKEKIK